jgi:hypothetical protein
VNDETEAWRPTAEDVAFCDVYGDWEPLTPADLQALMAGFPAPWWVVGGYAVEAFTGIRRFHEDIDLVVFGDDLPALREQFRDVFHLWSINDGTLRIIDDDHPEPLHPLAQVWMREDARSPWLIDCPVNPKRDGLWQSKRDKDLVAELDDVTWVADDGVRYLDAEIVLHYKALQHRDKDAIDLSSVWPLLTPAKQDWLRERVRRDYPDHPWQSRLDGVEQG